MGTELNNIHKEVKALLEGFGYKPEVRIYTNKSGKRFVDIFFHVNNGFETMPIRHKNAISMLAKGYLRCFDYASDTQYVCLYDECNGLNPEDAAELDRLSVREMMQVEPLHIKPQMIKGEFPIDYTAPIIGFDEALEPSRCSLIIQSKPKINKPKNLKYPNKKRAKRIWKKWKQRFGTTPGESIYLSDVEIITREEAQEILDNPLGVCETLAAGVKKDTPRMFTKFLERQNEQLSKIFRNEHKD